MKMVTNEELGEKTSFRNFLLILSILTGFIFTITFSSIYVSDAIKKGTVCGCVIPVPIMILILSSLGVFVGAITSYIFLRRIVLMKSVFNRERSFSKDFILKLLDKDERRVIEFLIKKNGLAYQSEISAFLNDRVKAHRIINRLSSIDFIKVTKEKKTNIVKLNKELYYLLSSAKISKSF